MIQTYQKWNIFRLETVLFKKEAVDLKTFCEKMLKEGALYLALDCSELQYVNNIGLQVIIECHQQVTPLGGKIGLLNVSKGIQELFMVTSINELCSVIDLKHNF